MTILYLCLVLIPAALAGCLTFVLAAAVANGRAEDEYLRRFWADTPSIESARGASAGQSHVEEWEAGIPALRKAA